MELSSLNYLIQLLIKIILNTNYAIANKEMIIAGGKF